MSVRDPRPTDPPLTRLRLERGLSLRQLGRVANLNPTRLWQLEWGVPSRRIEREKLAKVLGCEPDLLKTEASHDLR